MSVPSTHPSLLARLRDPRDEDAWRQFDAQYGGLIAAYARARGLQPADAEDVRQMVLAKLLRSLRAFEYRPERGRFRSYVWRVAQGEMIRLGRRHAVPLAGVMTDDELPPQADESLDTVWEREWMRHHFRQAWIEVRKSVEPKSLDVFGRLLAGDTVARIAATMDISQEVVRKVKQRIRRRLESQIQAQIRAEEHGDV